MEMTDKEYENAAHDAVLQDAETEKEEAKAQSLTIEQMDGVNTIKGELYKPLAKLQKARVRRDSFKQTFATAKAKFEADNSELLANLEDAKNKVSLMETDIRKLAIRIYTDTGTKTLDYGVTIREEVNFLYDYDATFAWVKENMCVFIVESLDVKEFEKALKTMKEKPEFISMEKAPKATLPKDIEKQFTPEGTQ